MLQGEDVEVQDLEADDEMIDCGVHRENVKRAKSNN